MTLIYKIMILKSPSVPPPISVNVFLESFLSDLCNVNSAFLIKIHRNINIFFLITRGRFQELVDRDIEHAEIVWNYKDAPIRLLTMFFN